MEKLSVLLGGAGSICNLSDAVGSWGFNVVAVTDGKQACGVLRASQCDMAILDWELPRVCGLDVCRWLRSVDVSTRPHMVLVTDGDNAEQIHEAYLAGADDYLPKPFNLENLHFVISAFAQKRRQNDDVLENLASFDPLEFYRRDLPASVRILS